jgi:hypothetical protein
MTDESTEGTPARYIDLALVAIACLILIGAHFFGGGTQRPTSPTGVDWDTVAPARPDTSGTLSGRQPLEIPDAVGKARSLLPGMRDADAVKSDLRNVVIVQEVYFSENSTYATDIEQLLPVGLTLRSGATVRILHGSQNGWAAVAIRSGSDTNSCVVHVGKQVGDAPPVTFRDGRSGSDATPVCDGDR